MCPDWHTLGTRQRLGSFGLGDGTDVFCFFVQGR
jgi:hypothetical protein